MAKSTNAKVTSASTGTTRRARKLDVTKRILQKMLTTNTGTHMLDSGGAYGRNWERNQGIDFEASPAATLEFWDRDGSPDIVGTLSVYHWLADRLEYDAKLDRRFYRWATRGSRADDPWLASAEEFVEHLAKHYDGVHRPEIAGIYGEDKPFTVNTYNGEDMLSQTLQYVYFTLDGEPYVLLQIHGGCDVRGGYTRPYAFRVSGMHDETSILDNAKGTIYCTGNSPAEDGNEQLDAFPETIVTSGVHGWTTDDTSHWYYEGSAGFNAGTQLDEYDSTSDESERGQGKLYIDDDRNGYCPKCGGKLALSAY